jgi:hypothetical protein
MANQNSERLYDLYLTTFGLARAGVSVNATLLKEEIQSGPWKPYTGLDLAAVVQGIAEGKAADYPKTKSELMTYLNKQLA